MSKGSIVEELGADLILVNGKVVSVDSEETVAEAVAVRDGRILRVGSNGEIEALAKGSARVIDLEGRTLLPGFVDSHEHVMRRGLMLDWVNCRSPPVETIQDIIDALAAKAAGKPEGEWVVGSWFDETKLSDGRWPTRYALDEARARAGRGGTTRSRTAWPSRRRG